jgi:predicted hydrocarbon binding protein
MTMEIVLKSGYYYPNHMARTLLKSLESVMGKNGLRAILNLVHLPALMDNYPPKDMQPQFDFADLTAILLGVEETYGLRGGQGLALRAGRAAFAEVLCQYIDLPEVGGLAFNLLPLSTRLEIGLRSIANFLSLVSDQQSTVEERELDYSFSVTHCPHCWNRNGQAKPVCFMGMGLLQEGLKWLSDGHEFKVSETRCMASGDDVCEYSILKPPFFSSAGV